MEIVRSRSAPRRAQRLLLGVTAATTLLLLGACGSETSTDSTSGAQIAAENPDSAVGSTGDNPTDGDSSRDGVTSADPNQDNNTAHSVPTAEQYLADANALLDAVTATSDTVATQLEGADVESAAWRTETAGVLRELAAVLDSAGDLAAPPEYATQHEALIGATSKYSWATEMLADGVETLDLNTISDAAALLANASLELATAKAGLAG